MKMTGYATDSNELRSIARGIGDVAAQVDELLTADVQGMQATVNDELKGATADAIAREVSKLGGDIAKISDALKTVQDALDKCAAQTEER